MSRVLQHSDSLVSARSRHNLSSTRKKRKCRRAGVSAIMLMPSYRTAFLRYYRKASVTMPPRSFWNRFPYRASETFWVQGIPFKKTLSLIGLYLLYA